MLQIIYVNIENSHFKYIEIQPKKHIKVTFSKYHHISFVFINQRYSTTNTHCRFLNQLYPSRNLPKSPFKLAVAKSGIINNSLT